MAGANNANSFKPRTASWSSTGAIDSATLIPPNEQKRDVRRNFNRTGFVLVVKEDHGEPWSKQVEHTKQKESTKGTRHKKEIYFVCLCFLSPFRCLFSFRFHCESASDIFLQQQIHSLPSLLRNLRVRHNSVLPAHERICRYVQRGRFTAARMIFCAFALFFFRFSITSVTVTASCCGCQQS